MLLSVERLLFPHGSKATKLKQECCSSKVTGPCLGDLDQLHIFIKLTDIVKLKKNFIMNSQCGDYYTLLH